MNATELLALISLLTVNMGRWFTMVAPPPELLNNLEFFKRADMIQNLDLLDYLPADKSKSAGATR